MIVIKENVDLQPFNTFRLKAVARYFTAIHSVEEFQELIHGAIYKNTKHLILGGGSNVLLTKNFDGLVIKVSLKGIEIQSETPEMVTLKVGAGENWHEFVMYCVDRDWGGIENLSLIPGTVGAAPMQNIGAYGVEIKDVVQNVTAIDKKSGEVRSFSNNECVFGYRESVFKQELKEKYFISSITLTLTKKNHQLNPSYGTIQATLNELGITQLSVKAISDAVITIRKQKLPDPAVIGNAGSFFKNPTIHVKQYEELKITYPTIPGYQTENQEVKIPAAWLIEQCGWKGKTFDSIGVHKNQALVLVNYGDGSGDKIWALALEIIESVKQKFNVTLQAEVNVI
jgi:UDP-N-acetylmuramate dehydrogenase